MRANKERGLYRKYKVERLDGKPIKEGCIVLEWKDSNAREGIKAFAKAVRANGFTQLADDLDSRLSEYTGYVGDPAHAEGKRDE